jgi:hypothetical protein
MKAAPSTSRKRWSAARRARQAAAERRAERRAVALARSAMRDLDRRMASGKIPRPRVSLEEAQRIMRAVLDDMALSADERDAKMMRDMRERSESVAK